MLNSGQITASPKSPEFRADTGDISRNSQVAGWVGRDEIRPEIWGSGTCDR